MTVTYSRIKALASTRFIKAHHWRTGDGRHVHRLVSGRLGFDARLLAAWDAVRARRRLQRGRRHRFPDCTALAQEDGDRGASNQSCNALCHHQPEDRRHVLRASDDSPTWQWSLGHHTPLSRSFAFEEELQRRRARDARGTNHREGAADLRHVPCGRWRLSCVCGERRRRRDGYARVECWRWIRLASPSRVGGTQCCSPPRRAPTRPSATSVCATSMEASSSRPSRTRSRLPFNSATSRYSRRGSLRSSDLEWRASGSRSSRALESAAGVAERYGVTVGAALSSAATHTQFIVTATLSIPPPPLRSKRQSSGGDGVAVGAQFVMSSLSYD